MSIKNYEGNWEDFMKGPYKEYTGEYFNMVSIGKGIITYKHNGIHNQLLCRVYMDDLPDYNYYPNETLGCLLSSDNAILYLNGEVIFKIGDIS